MYVLEYVLCILCLSGFNDNKMLSFLVHAGYDDCDSGRKKRIARVIGYNSPEPVPIFTKVRRRRLSRKRRRIVKIR